MSDFLSAGIARQIITPPPGTLLFGYPSERRGDVVADNLNATALVLQSDSTIAALVSLDLCVIDEEETAKIREAAAAQTGIPPENITIHATHTHSGPATITTWGWGEKNHKYLDLVRPKIVQAIVEAQQSLQPVRVGFGVTKTDVGINRRELTLEGTVKLGFNEWGARDDDLTVVRFEGKNGTVAQLIHLSAHPTSRGGEPSVSRDWPGVMMDRVEKITGAKVLFLNGAFGDVAPRTNIGGATGDGNAAATEVGLRAATDALRAFHSIKEFRDVPLQVTHDDIDLPYAPLPDLEETKKQIKQYAHAAESWGRENAEWNYWNAVLKAHEQPPQMSRIFSQTITRLGPLTLVPFPGEVFSEIVLRIKKHSPFAHTLCAGTCNGHYGYLVTREARARGGYEVWVMRAFSAYLLAENLDDVLVVENIRLLQKVFEK
jgi:hypothetical protein